VSRDQRQVLRLLASAPNGAADPPYDVLNDFVPISPLARTPVVFYAKKTMPAKDMTGLIAWLKANPNKASSGIYSAGGRLLAALFQKETGTQFALVPYRGGAPAAQDLVAGQIDLFLAAHRLNCRCCAPGALTPMR